ncbi:unnamed protein product [Prunus armeniaca]|uniref:Uncharacterized protein n=1 Tax=Prunus armeniaca TaxID=36596 RepID=A0A6J5TPX9_PRUAR|nr:unnamed protein product [Prunus armeniaca]
MDIATVEYMLHGISSPLRQWSPFSILLVFQSDCSASVKDRMDAKNAKKPSPALELMRVFPFLKASPLLQTVTLRVGNVHSLEQMVFNAA